MTWRTALWAALAFMAVGITLSELGSGDAASFYTFPFPNDYTGNTVYGFGHNWSPAFAFWIQPLQALPFEWFRLLFVGIEVAALAYLTSPLVALFLLVFQAPLVFVDVANGNLNLAFAVLIVWSLRQPAWLASPALTKGAAAVVGVWHLARGNWRGALFAAGVTLLIALPSIILAPDSWASWFGSLVGHSGDMNDRLLVPVALRLTFALGLVVYAARTDRPWLMPIGAALAGPHNAISWLMGLGAWRLWATPLPAVEPAESASERPARHTSSGPARQPTGP